jgi:GNAT superfamily N-acetyltransferase
MTGADPLARANAFDRRLSERMSTDVVRFDGGVAFLDTDFPLRYNSNMLWVDRPGAASAERWVEEADRILGSRGMHHRSVLVEDPQAARRLSMGFIEHGYAIDTGVLLVQQAAPDREHDLSVAEEASFEQLRPMMAEVVRREPYATSDEAVRQLTDHRRKMAEVVGARFFTARVDGEFAGCCEMYVDGDDAQVEAVDTLEEYRGRGVASAFVLRAAEEARAAGASWIHLWADADDWPRRWYERLGFVEIVETADRFERWPEGERPTNPAKSTQA